MMKKNNTKAVLVLGGMAIGVQVFADKIALFCSKCGKKIPEATNIPNIVLSYDVNSQICYKELNNLYEDILDKGYNEVLVLIAMRDWLNACTHLVEILEFNSLHEAWLYLMEAYDTIFKFIHENKLKYLIVDFEAFLDNPKHVLKEIALYFGLAEENIKRK